MSRKYYQTDRAEKGFKENQCVWGKFRTSYKMSRKVQVFATV